MNTDNNEILGACLELDGNWRVIADVDTLIQCESDDKLTYYANCMEDLITQLYRHYNLSSSAKFHTIYPYGYVNRLRYTPAPGDKQIRFHTDFATLDRAYSLEELVRLSEEIGHRPIEVHPESVHNEGEHPTYDQLAEVMADWGFINKGNRYRYNPDAVARNSLTVKNAEIRNEVKQLRRETWEVARFQDIVLRVPPVKEYLKHVNLFIPATSKIVGVEGSHIFYKPWDAFKAQMKAVQILTGHKKYWRTSDNADSYMRDLAIIYQRLVNWETHWPAVFEEEGDRVDNTIANIYEFVKEEARLTNLRRPEPLSYYKYIPKSKRTGTNKKKTYERVVSL